MMFNRKMHRSAYQLASKIYISIACPHAFRMGQWVGLPAQPTTSKSPSPWAPREDPTSLAPAPLGGKVCGPLGPHLRPKMESPKPNPPIPENRIKLKVTGYRSGCGYLSLCNGELWQHTDREHYKTYIIRQRSTYLMHTARTESLPRASQATDAVEIRFISVNILAKYLIVQTPRSSGLSPFARVL